MNTDLRPPSPLSPSDPPSHSHNQTRSRNPNPSSAVEPLVIGYVRRGPFDRILGLPDALEPKVPRKESCVKRTSRPAWLNTIVDTYTHEARVNRYWTAGLLLIVGAGIGGVLAHHLSRAEQSLEVTLSKVDKTLAMVDTTLSEVVKALKKAEEEQIVAEITASAAALKKSAEDFSSAASTVEYGVAHGLGIAGAAALLFAVKLFF